MELKMTGERLVTGLNNKFGTFEHLHRYALARIVSQGKVILDIASGEGYGTNLIAQTAKFAYGVDISEEAISHASKKYSAPNIKFIKGSTSDVPLEDASIDVVVSFETLEHHDEHEKMFSEIKRVLRKDGALLLSSPEKSIYSQRDPGNQFHIKELTLDQLSALASKYFAHTEVFFQRNIVGSFVYRRNHEEATHFFSGNFSEIHEGLDEKDFFNKDFFNLIYCTDSEDKFSFPPASFFCAEAAYSAEIMQWTRIKTSKSFKLGNFILSPFRVFRKLGR